MDTGFYAQNIIGPSPHDRPGPGRRIVTQSRSVNWNDRATIAHLVSRVGKLRDGVRHDRDQMSLVNLSPYQLDVLEECLLTRLTLMTKGGWAWFREEEEL